MTSRSETIERAGRRASDQVHRVLDEGRMMRRSRGISMSAVAAGIGCSRQLIGALEHSDTRHNGDAVRAGAPTLDPVFRLRGRAVMSALRAGHAPQANGIVLL